MTNNLRSSGSMGRGSNMPSTRAGGGRSQSAAASTSSSASSSASSKLRAERFARGLTQKQIAARIGVSHGLINWWEHGTVPSLLLRSKAVAFLGLDPWADDNTAADS